jgi:DNA polymerase-1
MARNNRLFLLDAYALIYRAHFGFVRNPLINSKGMNVGAIQGFLNTLLDLLKKEDPSHLAVFFDLGATNREAEHSFYKANRQETPEDIKIAVPIIQDILHAFHIPVVALEGYEADDLIGTIAKKAERQGYQVYMVTPDKDYGQLVSPNIFMYKPPFMGNPHEILGVPEILAKWEIKDPLQVIDILALMGDAVDNIPGIPKVGPKTAMKLIGEYGNLEAVLEDAPNIKGKLGENLREFAEQGRISKMLATIILDAPIAFDEDDYLLEEPDREKLAAIFTELEFRTLGRRILGESFSVNAGSEAAAPRPVTPLTPRHGEPEQNRQMNLFGEAVPDPPGTRPTVSHAMARAAENAGGKNLSNTEHTYHLADTPEKRAELVAELNRQTLFCLDTETTGTDPNSAEMVGMSFSWKAGEGWYVPLPASPEKAKAIVAEFSGPLGDSAITKVGQNLKYDLLVLRWHGVEVGGPLRDTMIAHYLLEPEKRHKMDYLAESYLGYSPKPIEDLIGRKGKGQLSMRDIDVERVAEYAAEDADITLQLQGVFAPMLKEQGIEDLYERVELPLLRVLADLEFEGVAIDRKFLDDYSTEMGKDQARIEAEVHEMAGVRFNLDSPKQLGEILFDKMGVEYKGKKTKTGQYSTAEDVLMKLAGEAPIVQKVLEYREIGKLKSTYVDALPSLINPRTGRVHSTFSQTVAATGRLSSNNPNLQNIPIRTERGREIRKAFVPRNKDFVLLSADYSQIELRIIAALSGDSAMLEAFKSGQDIHAATAAKVYGVPLESVSSDMRRKAKMVNFGIIYGISGFGLSQRLSVPRK